MHHKAIIALEKRTNLWLQTQILAKEKTINGYALHR